MKNLKKLIQASVEESKLQVLETYARANGYQIADVTEGNKITVEDLASELQESQEIVYANFTGRTFDGKEAGHYPKLNFKEAIGTSDVDPVFRRVISEVLTEPVEPVLFLTQIAEKVNLPANAPRLVEFTQAGPMQAQELSEGQAYNESAVSFNQMQSSIAIRKHGVISSLTEEVIQHSMWNLVAMNMRAMGNAINRSIEGALYRAMTERALVVFDNTNVSDSTFLTTGRSAAQAFNATFSYNDLVTMMGVLLANKYTATHMLAHPLAWPIFANDPFLKAHFMHNGQIGAGVWNRDPQFDQNSIVPFSIQYVPYYALPYTVNNTLSGYASGQAAVLTTDLYAIDQRNSFFLAYRGNTEMDEMENFYRDVRTMKARRYAGVATKDGGKGLAVAKNIRIDKNYEPLYTVRSVSA